LRLDQRQVCPTSAKSARQAPCLLDKRHVCYNRASIASFDGRIFCGKPVSTCPENAPVEALSMRRRLLLLSRHALPPDPAAARSCRHPRAQDLQPLEIASKSGVHIFGVEMAGDARRAGEKA